MVTLYLYLLVPLYLYLNRYITFLNFKENKKVRFVASSFYGFHTIWVWTTCDEKEYFLNYISIMLHKLAWGNNYFLDWFQVLNIDSIFCKFYTTLYKWFNYWKTYSLTNIYFFILDVEGSIQYNVLLRRLLETRDLSYTSHVDDSLQPSGIKRTYPCPNCNKVYQFRQSRHRHLKFECGKRPQFSCTACSYMSFHKSSVDKHFACKHT